MKEAKKRHPIISLLLTSESSHYILSVLVIGVTTLLCWPFAGTSNYHVVPFLFLFVVSIMATFFSIGPVLIAATLGSLIWNFFFIPPYYTFHIDKAEDILMFGMFFIIALLNGVLTTRVRRQEKLAIEREDRTNALFQLTKELSMGNGLEELKSIAGENIKKYFSVDSFFILQDGNNTLLPSPISPQQYSISKWVFENTQTAGKFTSTFPTDEYIYYPLQGALLKPGVIVLQLEKTFEEDKNFFWNTFVTQITNALEREFLGELAQKARFLDESDRLYKTLFNSISHELRIPVATIMGASDALLTTPYSATDQSALCTEIVTASVRLNRIIENLLNMSRLESGRFSVRLDWYDINDLINKVVEELKVELKPFNLVVSVPEDMPLVKIDFGLMEQVLYNLLLNACEHAPAVSTIRLNAGYSKGMLRLEIMDRGPGFPEKALKDVFKKFFRIDNNKTGGLGLGLSIVKGFVAAHKGTVMVENRKNGGARFILNIPSGNPQIKNLTMNKA